jgi:hypothetical protein
MLRQRRNPAPRSSPRRSDGSSVSSSLETPVPATEKKKGKGKKRIRTETIENEKDMDAEAREDQPLLDGAAGPEKKSWVARNQWIMLALASGACAAFNGVFAKL